MIHPFPPVKSAYICPCFTNFTNFFNFSSILFVFHLTINLFLFIILLLPIGAWLSLVERCVRDAEVASSNLVAPTIYGNPLNPDKYGFDGFLRLYDISLLCAGCFAFQENVSDIAVLHGTLPVRSDRPLLTICPFLIIISATRCTSYDANKTFEHKPYPSCDGDLDKMYGESMNKNGCCV